MLGRLKNFVSKRKKASNALHSCFFLYVIIPPRNSGKLISPKNASSQNSLKLFPPPPHYHSAILDSPCSPVLERPFQPSATSTLHHSPRRKRSFKGHRYTVGQEGQEERMGRSEWKKGRRRGKSSL